MSEVRRVHDEYVQVLKKLSSQYTSCLRSASTRAEVETAERSFTSSVRNARAARDEALGALRHRTPGERVLETEAALAEC